jgi:hypothetical protein
MATRGPTSVKHNVSEVNCFRPQVITNTKKQIDQI